MKKQGILNSHISEVLARLGHTDAVVIADCGLPIPDTCIRIDVSLKIGMPGFIETLEVLLDDMQVEKATLAEEIKTHNRRVEEEAAALLKGVPIDYLSHEEFKKETAKAKAVIRTGEASPYANIILHAGVIF